MPSGAGIVRPSCAFAGFALPLCRHAVFLQGAGCAWFSSHFPLKLHLKANAALLLGQADGAGVREGEKGLEFPGVGIVCCSAHTLCSLLSEFFRTVPGEFVHTKEIVCVRLSMGHLGHQG